MRGIQALTGRLPPALSLMERLLWKLRARTLRRSPVRFLKENPKYSAFRVGDWSYGEPEVVYWDSGAQLTIGRFCSLAPGVTILLGGEHHSDWVTTYPFSLIFPGARSLPGYPLTKGDVEIGNDVWIGHGALILSGVTIGNGAVVGARSVVVRDVEPYAVVAGAPARTVRERFPPDTVAALQRIAWWNWPQDRIREAWPLLCDSDIGAFLRTYGEEGRVDR
jgi:acetyltransferase-like isoleucine patch superfamily enzyme